MLREADEEPESEEILLVLGYAEALREREWEPVGERLTLLLQLSLAVTEGDPEMLWKEAVALAETEREGRGDALALSTADTLVMLL